MRITLFLLLCLSLLAAGCSGFRSRCDLSDYQPQEGDLVFRRGNGPKSSAVMLADTAGVYSHIGIVVSIDSIFQIVHIAPGEQDRADEKELIKLETFSQFFQPKRARSGAVMRFTDSVTCSSMAAKHALRIWGERVEFDHDYDLEDSARMYCTELIWHAYRLAGRDVTNGTRSEIRNFGMFTGVYVFPSDICKNNSLSTIYQF